MTETAVQTKGQDKPTPTRRLFDARRAMGTLAKNAVNPHFKSKYADLPAVLDVIDDPLADHGLSAVQTTEEAGEPPRLVLRTWIADADSGERVGPETVLPVLCVRPNDPQALGSAITYARRYALVTLLGLAPEDDDGNAGSGRGTPPPASGTAQKPASRPAKGLQGALAESAKAKDATPPANALQAEWQAMVEDMGSEDVTAYLTSLKLMGERHDARFAPDATVVMCMAHPEKFRAAFGEWKSKQGSK